MRRGPEEAYLLVVLAEACGKMGQNEEGISVLQRPLLWYDKGVRIFEAELYRLKGELLLAQASKKQKNENLT